MTAPHPKFQPQLPKDNCVIDGILLGGVSCTAYAMAMLIDAATEGEEAPKGCKVRRLVNPEDLEEGLMLSQVAKVADRKFDVPVSVRTGPRAVPVSVAIRRIRNGRGFVLQGNTGVFGGRAINHAVYVHRVRGVDHEHGGRPLTAVVYDPARAKPHRWSWDTVLKFAAGLQFDEAGKRTLGPGRMYAGFAPRRATKEELDEHPAVKLDSGVELRFGAEAFPNGKRRFRADVERGHAAMVRRRPDRIEAEDVVDTLERGEQFVGWQRLLTGKKPQGSNSRVWIGNKDGTQWVHRGGLRRIDGDD